MPAPGPRTVTANEGIDLVVDSAQNFKNFVNKAFNSVVAAGIEGKDEVNDLIDQLIDKLQGMKG